MFEVALGGKVFICNFFLPLSASASRAIHKGF